MVECHQMIGSGYMEDIVWHRVIWPTQLNWKRRTMTNENGKLFEAELISMSQMSKILPILLCDFVGRQQLKVLTPIGGATKRTI